MQPVDDQPLRAGQAQPAHPPVEGGAHQPRDIRNQKADVALVVVGQRGFPFSTPRLWLPSILSAGHSTQAMSDGDARDPVALSQRIMIMISIILGSTLYSTTLLIASSLLPQMQGAMA